MGGVWVARVAVRRVSGTHITLLRLSAGQSGMMGNRHNPVSSVFGPITPVTNFSQSRGAVKPATLADSLVYLPFVCPGLSSGSSMALVAASPRSISWTRGGGGKAAAAAATPTKQRGDKQGRGTQAVRRAQRSDHTRPRPAWLPPLDPTVPTSTANPQPLP